MKQKNLKLILFISLLFSLVGCGSSDKEDSQSVKLKGVCLEAYNENEKLYEHTKDLLGKVNVSKEDFDKVAKWEFEDADEEYCRSKLKEIKEALEDMEK